MGAGSVAGSGPEALDPGGAGNPGNAPAQGAETVRRAGRKPRAARASTEESPIAFRPRPGTRALLDKRAGDRALSVVVEAAVDAYLGRKVTDVDPKLRAAIKADLAPLREQLAVVAAQEAGIGRNLNQQTRFLNTYRELPAAHAEQVAELTRSHEAVVSQLAAIHAALDSIVAGR